MKLWSRSTSEAASTRALVRWLRKKSGTRGLAARRVSFALYIVALGTALYGWPVIAWVASKLASSHARTQAGPGFVRALPIGLAILFFAVVFAACRNALWRGPVSISEADAAWLLPTPLDRGVMLRSRLAIALAVAGAAGAIAGAMIALLASALHPHLGDRVIGGMIGYGGATGVIAIAVASIVETSDAAKPLVRRASPHALGFLGMLGVVCVGTAQGRGWEWPNRVAMWSGPWGWAAQLATPNEERAGTVIPVALSLLVVVGIAVVAIAVLQISEATSETLRTRARLDRYLSTDLGLGDTRSARLAINAARTTGVSTSFRVAVPGSSRLAIAWRDTTALGRAPGRLAWSAVFTAASALVLGLGAALASNRDPSPVVVGAAVLLAYFAATSLLEVARIEKDTPVVTAQLPLRYSEIAARHVVVPTVVLTAFGGVAAVVGALSLGASPLPCVAVVIVAAPVLALAALGNAYGASLSIGLTMTDAYGIGASFATALLLVGPMLALIALTPTTVYVFDQSRDGKSVGHALITLLIVCVLATAAGARILSGRATARVRT